MSSYSTDGVVSISNLYYNSTTSMESIVDTFLYFLDNRGITGQLVEVSGEKRIVLPPREAANGTASKRAAATWGPVFTYVHGEPSEDPDEITW